jgi:hypothetical protein
VSIDAEFEAFELLLIKIPPCLSLAFDRQFTVKWQNQIFKEQSFMETIKKSIFETHALIAALIENCK